jgi:hypothetical protein
VIVIVPTALFDRSATLMAVTETPGGAVRTCGAVYVPDESTVPQLAPAHPFPETIQVMERSGLPAEFTFAVNGRAAPSSTGIPGGETDSEMSLAIVSAAAALFELSAALVACTITPAGIGRSPGET